MAKGRHRSTEEESIVFPNTFIRDLPENPWAALNHVAHMIISYESTAVDTKSLPSQQIQARANTYESYLMAFRIAEAIIEANNMPIKVPKLDISNVHGNGKSISEFMVTIADISYHRAVSFHSESEINSIKGQIMLKWKNAFAYEFSDGDLLRIQNLINELRSEIATTNKLDDKYKARLLRRLEKLQNEINKRIASLDSLWALVGEAGVVLGKLGTDAKPLIDRFKEIVDIIWRTQARSEELSSNTPPALLDSHDKSLEEHQEGPDNN